MKWWLLLKKFPQFALVAGIIFVSTALFLVWWFTHSLAKSRPAGNQDAERAAIQRQAAKVESRTGFLFLADDDLYDAETGELIFKNWLHGDKPLRLFYDPKTKKILGQYAQGFARYALDGTREATLMQKDGVAFCDGNKRAVFARDKNVWTAEADWQNFRWLNERPVTDMGIFNERYLVENILLLTGKTLVVSNFNTLLRVNLETGNVKPTRNPLGSRGSSRSPDGRWVVGTMDGQFFCYDVDADLAKTIPVGRAAWNDCLWQGNDKCVGLEAGEAIAVYDRLAHRLTEVTTLPFSCFKMDAPSPDGHFVFCAGGIEGRNGALVDLEKKTAVRVIGGAGICWVSNDTFAFSREVPDSDWRGTWLQSAGQAERRVSADPYLVTNGRAQLLALPSAGLVIFATRHGLTKMKQDGTGLSELVKMAHPPARVMGIQEWKMESMTSL